RRCPLPVVEGVVRQPARDRDAGSQWTPTQALGDPAEPLVRGTGRRRVGRALVDGGVRTDVRRGLGVHPVPTPRPVAPDGRWIPAQPARLSATLRATGVNIGLVGSPS